MSPSYISANFNLLLEILEFVVAELTQHDLTICARVCKSWHSQFINDRGCTVKI